MTVTAEGKHLPDALGEARQGLTEHQDAVTSILSDLREQDAREERRRRRHEADRRGWLFIIGGGSFWIGLLMAWVGPSSASGSFVVLSGLWGWPIFWGLLLCGLGVALVVLRTRVTHAPGWVLIALSVWYVGFAANFVGTYLAVLVGVIESQNRPALYAGAVYFTFALFCIKGLLSLREAIRDRGQ